VLRMIFWGLLLASVASGDDLSLPPSLELVSRDSISVTVREKDSGIVHRYLLEGGNIAPNPGWVMQPGAALAADTCFTFQTVGHVRPMVHDLFGEADHDGLNEIVGVYGGRTWIYEYSGHDTTYLFQDTLYDTYPLDYGHNSDGDSLLEYLAMGLFHEGFTIYESPTYNSLPDDSIFAWPHIFPYKAGTADIDGDERVETYFKTSFNHMEVWRSTGNNSYAFAYTIDLPDSLWANFSDFVFGDFDSDGRIEMINTSDRGILLAYECVAPESFRQVWRGQVSHYNANEIVGPTDMDQDGRLEFVVMSNSISRGGFFYYFFETTGDNQFEQIYVDSIPGDAWENGGMGLWDFDRHGADELAVCAVDNGVGLFKSAGNNSCSLIYFSPSIAGDVRAFDTNDNGFGEMILDEGLVNGTVVLEYSPGRGLLGDVNCDCAVNLSDPLYLVNYLKGIALWLPPDIHLADVNGTCQVNGVDVTYFVNYFHNGPALIDGNCR